MESTLQNANIVYLAFALESHCIIHYFLFFWNVENNTFDFYTLCVIVIGKTTKWYPTQKWVTRNPEARYSNQQVSCQYKHKNEVWYTMVKWVIKFSWERRKTRLIFDHILQKILFLISEMICSCGQNIIDYIIGNILVRINVVLFIVCFVVQKLL